MKKAFFVLSLMLFSTLFAFAAGDNFQKLDKNNDGKISKKEYLDAVAATFKKYDLNKDGVLSKEEIKSIERKIETEKFIKDVDSNNDGKIERNEFIVAAEKMFLRIDKNKDNYIDRKEWNAGKSSSRTLFVLFTF
jgi:Ca2+-binding EF-hand superfamily protein